MTPPTHAISEYFEALTRLKIGRPINVLKGTKICNDSVALEAGRGKGSIKKSRPVFRELIQSIEAASAEQTKSSSEKKLDLKFEKMKAEALQYRRDLEVVTASLVSRIYEIYELKKQIRLLEESVQHLTDRPTLNSGPKVSQSIR